MGFDLGFSVGGILVTWGDLGGDRDFLDLLGDFDFLGDIWRDFRSADFRLELFRSGDFRLEFLRFGDFRLEVFRSSDLFRGDLRDDLDFDLGDLERDFLRVRLFDSFRDRESRRFEDGLKFLLIFNTFILSIGKEILLKN